MMIAGAAPDPGRAGQSQEAAGVPPVHRRLRSIEPGPPHAEPNSNRRNRPVRLTPTNPGKATDLRGDPVLHDHPKGWLTETSGRPHAPRPAASLMPARVR